jgi:hypothetical protein
MKWLLLIRTFFLLLNHLFKKVACSTLNTEYSKFQLSLSPFYKSEYADIKACNPVAPVEYSV